MANSFVTPDNIAAAGLAAYQFNAVLPRLCSRVYETDFGGGSGDTITIRSQARLTASVFSRATGIVPVPVADGSLTFTVSDLWDISAEITQEQWDLDLTDFNFQVSEPMAKSMVRASEGVINDVIDAITPGTGSYASILDDIVDARALLNADEVPLENRVLVVGSNVASKLILNDNLIKANWSGSAEVLRNATIGRLFGMDTVESVIVDPDKAYLWHKDAVTFASITPSLPRGAANAAVQTYDSQAVRVVFSYDQNKKQDVVSMDSYLAAKVIRSEGVQAIHFS